MKNFAIATLAVVTLTMLASDSAQAQTGYGNSFLGFNTQLQANPYGNYVTPAAYNYGSNSNYGSCANGRCNTTGYQTNYPTNVFRNEYGTSHYGSTYPTVNTYPTGTYNNSYYGNSYYGTTPRTNTPCATGVCPSPGQGTTNYRPTPYGSYGYSNSPYGNSNLYGNGNLNSQYGNTNVNFGNTPYYNSN